MTDSRNSHAAVNPFQSPSSVEHSLRPPHQWYWENQRGRGPAVMFFRGAVLGGVVAAVTAAVGATAFSIVVEFPGLALAPIAAILASIEAVMAGVPVGAILGLVAGRNKPRVRRLLTLIAAATFALIIALIGLGGGLALVHTSGRFQASTALTISAGVICGAITGTIGGWCFARRLANICWGQPPSRPNNAPSSVAGDNVDDALLTGLSQTRGRFSIDIEPLNSGRFLKTHLHQDKQPLTYDAVLDLWQNDAEFRRFFSAHLAACPFAAFRWETPPVTADTLNRPFEFVLLDCPALVGPADSTSFAKQLSSAQPADIVIAFANLGRDAYLVVPCAVGPESAYGHLAAFVREAPASQQHALWQTVAAELRARISQQPLWLSTAGLGVPWLHVRIDTRPKYYGHGPYRTV